MSNLEISRAERLDQYVVRQLPSLSRAYANRLIALGKVTVNGLKVSKPGYKIRPADKIKIEYEASEALRIPSVTLPILYEDEDCVVINKPVGMLSHSKGAFNPEATVASWLREHIVQLSAASSLLAQEPASTGDRTGIVHRLDRATSGVMICAKNPPALSWLQKQFAQRKVKKVYQAVVQGSLTTEHAMIDMPIERNPKKPQTFRVGSNGKTALTEYMVLKTGNGLSLLELRPQTGRTHQLRVHLGHLGHAIVGDTLYDGQAAERLFLHAKSLEITIPNRQRKVFTAAVPPSFNALLRS